MYYVSLKIKYNVSGYGIKVFSLNFVRGHEGVTDLVKPSGISVIFHHSLTQHHMYQDRNNGCLNVRVSPHSELQMNKR